MLLLRLYDCISLITTDESLHHWLASFAGHRKPIKKTGNWLKLIKNKRDECFKILDSSEWCVEKKNGSDILYSRNIQNIGKVFKFEGVINSNIENLKKLLLLEPEDNPKWNETLQDVKVIEEIDKRTCITFSRCKRYGAMSPREFVHLRSWTEVNNQSVLVCVSIDYPKPIPESGDLIRAEHRLFTYILRPMPNEPSKTHFTWLMSVHLKGWIPQTLVDQTVFFGMHDHVKVIRSHVEK